MINRFIKLKKHLRATNLKGVIIFSSGGLSFLEKSMFAYLCKMYNKKTILFIRSGFILKQYEENLFLRLYYKILFKLPLVYGVQGRRWYEFLINVGVKGENVNIIRNWATYNDANRFKIKINHPPKFFFAGWITKHKGILDLLNAYKNSKVLLGCELILAGSGDLFDEIKYLKKIEGLSKIKLLGWIDANLISEYMKNVDVLVLPSYAEGFPNVIVEALWHSLPVISSDVGSISDSVINDYNGNLFAPGDIDALKGLMENLVLNNQTIKIYSENSLKIAKKIIHLIKIVRSY